MRHCPSIINIRFNKNLIRIHLNSIVIYSSNLAFSLIRVMPPALENLAQENALNSESTSTIEYQVKTELYGLMEHWYLYKKIHNRICSP